MRLFLAVIALAFMIPVAHAHNDDDSLGPDGNPPAPIEGGVCIQTIQGPTVCN